MRDLRQPLRQATLAGLVLASFSLGGVARADDPLQINVTIKDHRFDPAEIHVPAGKPVVLMVTNQDNTAEEFDSTALRVEKVIAASRYATVRLRPLGPGRYPCMGEFHPDTATGVVVSE